MYIIRNLKRRWFVTKRNVSMSSPSVPHSSSRLFLLHRRAPAKHRRSIKAFMSVSSVSLTPLSQLKLVSIRRIYWFLSRKILSEISLWMKQFHASKSIVVFLSWLITPLNFIRIFRHLRRMWVERFTLPQFNLTFQCKQLSVASTSLQQK